MREHCHVCRVAFLISEDGMSIIGNRNPVSPTICHGKPSYRGMLRPWRSIRCQLAGASPSPFIAAVVLRRVGSKPLGFDETRCLITALHTYELGSILNACPLKFNTGDRVPCLSWTHGIPGCLSSPITSWIITFRPCLVSEPSHSLGYQHMSAQCGQCSNS